MQKHPAPKTIYQRICLLNQLHKKGAFAVAPYFSPNHNRRRLASPRLSSMDDRWVHDFCAKFDLPSEVKRLLIEFNVNNLEKLRDLMNLLNHNEALSWAINIETNEHFLSPAVVSSCDNIFTAEDAAMSIFSMQPQFSPITYNFTSDTAPGTDPLFASIDNVSISDDTDFCSLFSSSPTTQPYLEDSSFSQALLEACDGKVR